MIAHSCTVLLALTPHPSSKLGEGKRCLCLINNYYLSTLVLRIIAGWKIVESVLVYLCISANINLFPNFIVCRYSL